MRTIVFIDGQNLYHLARIAWGSSSSPAYSWPSYDVLKLSRALVNKSEGRILSEVRFYTGVPTSKGGVRQEFWRVFWSNKIRHLERQGIYVYRGRINSGGQEKGVDVSLAIDLIRATYESRYEAAIVVSQDSDFAPAVSLAKQISRGQGRTLVFESWVPVGPRSRSHIGVPGTDWRVIDKETYDACRETRDFRPRKISPSGRRR